MELKESILKTILYFDVFDYPLSKEDISNYMSMDCSTANLEQALHQMVLDEQLFCFENVFYSVQDDVELVNKRKASNILSKKLEPLAFKNAKLISKFPFVSSVAISGSMSKGVMFEDSDIDYFIICKAQRLWLGRAFLVLYKRLFLNNSKEHFCINFFMSEDDLSIRERNLFTAIELSSLIGVTGKKQYHDLLSSNAWAKDYINKFKPRDKNFVEAPQKFAFSKLIEFMLKRSFGNFLEARVLKLFHKRNLKKYAAKLSSENFELMYRSDTTQAKVHSGGHQAKVLKMYNQRIKDYSRVKLNHNG